MRLWDLPVRIFHWSLVIAVLVAFVTAKLGGDWMDWHGRAGLAIVGLVTFRLVWGVVGSTHARFLSFAPTPSRLRAYLTGRWHGIGHNPLGALSVFGLLGLLAAQAGTGLFSNDDIAFDGPLSGLIEKARSDSLTGLHHQLSDVLLVLLGLHILAIAFYLIVKKTNLVKPMITGWKHAQDRVAPVPKTRGGSPLGLIVALLVAAAVTYAASGRLLHRPPPPPAAAPATSPPPATYSSTPGW
ncbi:cytochrome B561 [Massilia sp. JS1662]|nr:cytochrome B561 [Massilia sp. JS1662]